MKRLLLSVVALIVLSGLFAFDWQWEQNLELPATAIYGENAVQAVGDTLYLAYLGPTSAENPQLQLYFCKSSASGTVYRQFDEYAGDYYGKPSLTLDLPNIHILVQVPEMTLKFNSADFGNHWSKQQIYYEMLKTNAMDTIIRQGDTTLRTFAVNSSDGVDTHYYFDKHITPHGNNSYYYGPDVITGAVKVNGDLHIKQAGGGNNSGWPTFLDEVIISGTVISDPPNYPVDQVFQGGLRENANLSDAQLKPELYLQKLWGESMRIGEGDDHIYLIEGQGNTVRIYHGFITHPIADSAEVYSSYPPLPGTGSEYLYTNHYRMPKLIWSFYNGFYIPRDIFVNGTVWIKGTFSGVSSIYSWHNIYIIGDILLSGTPAGQSPASNTTDKVSLLTNKQIIVKYGYKDPVTGESVHTNCRADTDPIYIYADLFALNNYNQNPFNAGYFTFEYQHPHPSTPPQELVIDGETQYFDDIDLHRYHFPPTAANPWPANIDYPWYNPLWPEAHPYLERGKIVQYGALYQDRSGYIHRSHNDAEYPSNVGIWDIANDQCGGPTNPVEMPDPVIPGLVLQSQNFPGAMGSGVGYKRELYADNRDFPDLSRHDIWGLGAYIIDFINPNPQGPKWHKGNFAGDYQSVDYYDGEWLFQSGNTLLTYTEVHNLDLAEDWQIKQAKLSASNKVISLQHKETEGGVSYRVQIANIDGSESDTVYSFSLIRDMDFIALNRIADGFLLPIPDFAEGKVQVLRFDLEGNISSHGFSFDLPEVFWDEDISQSMLTLSNSSENTLHACMWFRSGDNAATVYHKYGNITPLGVEEEIQSPVLATLSCYPNPFGAELKIRVDADKSAAGSIWIYNIRGQRVREILFNFAKGKNEIAWDGKDQNGAKVPAGIYFVKAKGLEVKSRKVLKM
ncbi:MAG: FlgD immunoglobulin-like domain containing protein [Candidatus Cloacimonadaceae bacterium]